MAGLDNSGDIVISEISDKSPFAGKDMTLTSNMSNKEGKFMDITFHKT